MTTTQATRSPVSRSVGSSSGPHALSPAFGKSRVSGAAPGLMEVLNEWARAEDVRVETGSGSISGAMARTPRAEAMMARGARVTGSGSTGPADRGQEVNAAVAIFGDLKDFAVKSFL